MQPDLQRELQIKGHQTILLYLLSVLHAYQIGETNDFLRGNISVSKKGKPRTITHLAAKGFRALAPR